VRIARQIGEHSLGSGEGRLGVDHRSLLSDGSVVAQELPPLDEMSKGAEERKPSGLVQCDQGVRNRRRNSLPSTRTGRRKAGREESASCRARCLRPARSCGHEDGGSSTSPMCGARR
jgi:hypothetical protein